MSYSPAFLFQFSFIRFFLAVVLMTAAVLKAYQLTAVPLPPPIQNSVFTPLLIMLDNHFLLQFAVECEILFSLFLFSRILPQWLWLLSLFCFSAFAAVSAIKWVSGADSCGCFGVLTVPPRITTLFDLTVVFVLFRCRPAANFHFYCSAADRRTTMKVFLLWTVLSVPLLTAMLLQQSREAVLGNEMTDISGRKKILLKPVRWIGKRFPLAEHFENRQEINLLQGSWTAILFHSDCAKCKTLISAFEKTPEADIVLIEISSVQPVLKSTFPVVTLHNRNDWFAVTPCIIKITDGICTSVQEDQ